MSVKKLRFTRIPQDTFEALQTNAGLLLKTFDPDNPNVKDEDIICATTGGITVSCVPTTSDYGADVDNCPNNVLELMNLDSWDNSITTTGLGTSPELIRRALGAADVDGNKITPRAYLQRSDFQDAWWVGDRADGGLVAVHQRNSLSTGGFVLKTTKNGKGQVSLTLRGHVSLQDQDVMPMEFFSADPVDEEEENPTESSNP